MNEKVNQQPDSRQERPHTAMEVTAADIVETTRRGWLAGEAEPQTRVEQTADREPKPHPLVRFALDPRRLTAWYARVEKLMPREEFPFWAPRSRWRYLP